MSGVAFVGGHRPTRPDLLTWLPRTAAKVLLVAALGLPLLAAAARQLAARLRGDVAATQVPALLAAGAAAAGDVWADERGRLLLLAAAVCLGVAWMRQATRTGTTGGGVRHRSHRGGRDPRPSGPSAAGRSPTGTAAAANGTAAGGTRLERVAQQGEPPPRGWLVPGLIPDGPAPRRRRRWRWRFGFRPWAWERRGYVAAVVAQGGLGKSLLMADLALAACTGGAWLGLPVRRAGAALYVDCELDGEEFRRRVYPLARGRGLTRLPRSLHYLQLHDSLASPEGQERVRRAARRCGAGVVVVDSVSLGSWGVSLNDPGAMGRVFAFLESLGVPVPAVDHLGKDATKGAVGSFVKQAKVRSLLLLTRGRDGAILAEHAKSSFGPALPPFRLRPRLEGGAVVGFEREDAAAAPTARQAAVDARVLAALTAHGPNVAVARADLALATGYAEKTAANSLTRLRAAGAVEPVGGGAWRLRPVGPG